MSFISDRPSSFHDVSKMASKPGRATSNIDSNATSGVISSCVRASPFPFPASGQDFSPKVSDMAAALYGLPYGSHASASHLYAGSSAFDPLALYTALNCMDSKEIPHNWRSMHPHLEPYDASMASLFYQGVYPSLMLADRIPRKNATKETTATLKKWLNEHMKNPYPTKTEKIILAMASKMTLTQVSTWFANARRRLKKENKMTWSPRNRCSEDRETDDDDEKEQNPASQTPQINHPGTLSPILNQHDDISLSKSDTNQNRPLAFHHYQQQMLLRQIASFSSRYHAPEALGHHHDKLMLHSAWKEEPVSNGIKSGSFVTSDKVGMGLQNIQPSPHFINFRKCNPSPIVPLPHLEKSFGFNQLHSGIGAVTSKPKEDMVSPLDRSNQGDQKRNKSIWSPVDMTDNESRSDKMTSSQNSARSPQRSISSLGLASDRKNRISVDSEVSTGSCLSSFTEDSPSSLSPSMSSRNKLHPGTLAAHQSLIRQQQLFAAKLASSNNNKNTFLSHNSSLDKLDRYHPFHSHIHFPQLTTESNRLQEEKPTESSSQGNDDHHSDQEPNTPMNLSSRSKEQEGDASVMKLNVGQESRTSSVTSN